MGVSPCQLLMGRQLKTCLDLILPDIHKHVESAQSSQKQHHNCRFKPRNFQQGDKILVRDYRGYPYWLPGVIKDVLGPLLYVTGFWKISVMSHFITQIFINKMRNGNFQST